MAYLKVNGVEVQCDVAAGSDVTPVLIGEDARAFSGAPFTTERAVKCELSGRTLLLPKEEVAGWRGLLGGAGHVLAFEVSGTNPTGLATSRGLLPSNALAGAVFASGANTSKYGSYYCWVGSSGATLAYTLGAEYAAGWTALAWRRSGGAWRHYIRTGTSAGATAAWRDGVAHVTSDAWATNTTGTVALVSNATAADFDDVVFLPYTVPAAWVSGLYAFHSARAFPALPRVALSGDVVDVGLMPTGAMGRPGKAQAVYLGNVPTFTFDFTLRGV